jgi:spore coat polysaccharide biosynthesis protein SpsF
MTARTVAIIQARMGSTRLPGKVLLPLVGRPILSRVVERTARAERIDEVVVATTVDPSDEPIVNLAAAEGWAVERASESDLLDRYIQVARAHEADIVVRITSDCPLIDPALIDQTIEAFVDGRGDYASNTLVPRTYPRGLDVEVVSMDALEAAWRDDADPASREHVTPFLYRNPDRFRLVRVSGPDDRSAHRWCVDVPEDYELVRRIYDELGRDDFTWRQALEIVESHPSWASVNRDVVQKVVPQADK